MRVKTKINIKGIKLQIISRTCTLLLCISFLQSCKKEEPIPTHITGTVIEYGSEKPIEHARVELYQGVSNSTFGAQDILLDYQFTDEHGKFKFENKDYELYRTYVLAEHSQYYGIHQYSNNINKISDSRSEIILDPFAWAKVYYREVSIRPYYMQYYLTSLFNSQNIHLINRSNTDSTVIVPVYGNRENKIEVYGLDNKLNQYVFDTTAYFSAYDTVSVKMYY